MTGLRRAARLAVLLLCGLTVAATFACPGARAQDAATLDISSKHYIVVDADTGEVFAQHDADAQVAMASLTKIFTSIEAIETAPGNTEITTSADDMVSSEATSMGFGPGETFTLDQLLYGMLLPSGNDAARAVARSLGAQPGDADASQSVQHFMDRLNQRLLDMGLSETHLVNPDGWGVPGHHSSARDLATFMMYAVKYPRFVSPIGTEEADIDGYDLVNTNKLIGHYAGLLGGKTGYDDDAGYCLVEVAQRDGSTMISVTLDGVAPDIWYEDNKTLLDYAFAQKAARVAAGAPITGQVLHYKDPDAAVIARGGQSGASLGAPLALAAPAAGPAAAVVHPALAAPAAAPPVSIQADGAAPQPAAAPGGVPRWLAPAAVALLLIVGSVLRAGGVGSLLRLRRPLATDADPAADAARPAV